jgi:hypothetical protein
LKPFFVAGSSHLDMDHPNGYPVHPVEWLGLRSETWKSGPFGLKINDSHLELGQHDQTLNMLICGRILQAIDSCQFPLPLLVLPEKVLIYHVYPHVDSFGWQVGASDLHNFLGRKRHIVHPPKHRNPWSMVRLCLYLFIYRHCTYTYMYIWIYIYII